MRQPLGALLASTLALSPAGAWAQTRTHAQVLDATHTRAWLDAGRDDGLVVGARWEPSPGVAWAVVAVARRSAAIEATRGALPPRGSTVPLPESRSASPPPPPGPREAPPAPAPWDTRYALGATPWLPAATHTHPADPTDDPFDDDPRHRPRGLRGEVALRLLVGGSPGVATRGYHDLGLVSQVSAAWGRGWTHDHLVEARVVASPELMFVPLQHPQARLDVYLLRFGYLPPGSAVGVEFGRVATLPGAAVGPTDGARVRWRPDGGRVELSAFAGARPNGSNLAPTLAAPRAGASVRARFGDPGSVRGRLDATLVVDGWNTSVDRVFSTLGAGLDLGARASLSGEAVLDFAPDAQGAGARVTRAIADARVDLLRGALRLQATGGVDRPLYTASLRAQIPDLPALPLRRFVSLGADLRAHARLWTFLSARATDDPTGLRVLVTDLGLRVLDLPGRGSHASLRARWGLGDRVDSVGAHAAWSFLLTPITHVEAGLGVDRFVFGDNAITTWAYRARIAGDHRFGARWRGAISYEASWGAFALQHLAFVLLGYRLG
jgi:hypothetical protein